MIGGVEAIGAGLCDSCRHQRVVPNTRGSRFSLCELSKDDPRYPRYPRIPVGACTGYSEDLHSADADADADADDRGSGSDARGRDPSHGGD